MISGKWSHLFLSLPYPTHICIEIKTMPLLNLDNIIIQKTIIGINCMTCGGNLKLVEKKSFAQKIIKAFTLGTFNTKLYQCESCKKIYTVI